MKLENWEEELRKWPMCSDIHFLGLERVKDFIRSLLEEARKEERKAVYFEIIQNIMRPELVEELLEELREEGK